MDARHLPARRGRRPRTSTQTPHRQLDQQPTDGGLLDRILAEALTWPHVAGQPSAISVEGARALTLAPGANGGPPEAFLVGREFCHVHARGDFSLHAALAPETAAAAEDAGWVEPHFLAAAGRLPGTVVLIYAPRDDDEGEVVLRLIRRSYEFALTPSDQPVP